MGVFRHCAFALTLLGFMSFAVPVVAEEETTAFGRINATIACDSSNGNGLEVIATDELLRGSPFVAMGIDVQRGDDCLSSLVKFPPRMLHLADVLPDDSQGVVVGPQSRLVWFIDEGPNSREITITGFGTFQASRRRGAVCKVTEQGGWETVFVVGTTYMPQIGEPCGVTRRNLAMDNASPPMAVSLYNDGSQTLGGLLFTGIGVNTVEMITCNVDVSESDLEVTHYENQDGVDDNLVGAPCLNTISAREAAVGGLKFALNAVPAGEKLPVSIFLVNGIKLQGQIDSF